jgi:competence/damage-inducible protein CinA-like protein
MVVPSTRDGTGPRLRYAAPVAAGPDGSLATPTGTASSPLLTSELLSVGSELTVGETRDTNAGELARSLAGLGVRVLRMSAVPDDLAIVVEAFASAVDRADLVVSTGGLGPTPDDLTREAIAQLCAETPAVDPDLEAWLRGLWRRRGMPFPALNLKQAWLIPSAAALPNPNGTAPGWWVERPNGGVVVALPGPPREMRPMWNDEVLPRLRIRGLGRPVVSRTLRLTGIGESQVADMLGERLLRAPNPIVATYARAEAVDIRISAIDDGNGRGDDGDEGGHSAEQLVADAETVVLAALSEHVWAQGETTWSEAIGAELDRLGWTLSVVEIGTGGSVGRLLGDRSWLRLDESLAPNAPAATAHGSAAAGLVTSATRGREAGGTDVGLAVRARPRGGDTAVSVAVVTPAGEHSERRLVFLDGELGRMRAAIAAAAVVLVHLRAIAASSPSSTPTTHAQPPGTTGPPQEVTR